ncbi:MAG: OmpA family protein [Paludibacteraceae bacterium]|nr:OmpA family protein [Paludibacteraceae bacterium]
MKQFSYIFFGLVVLLWLPSCGLKTKIKRADRKFAIGEYYDAADLYRQIYPRVSRNDKKLKGRIAFNQGECYRILNNSKAVSSYQHAVSNKYQQQDSIVFLRLAQALQYQGKYSQAEKNYKSYLEAHPSDYVAQAGLFACQQVNTWKKEPSRHKLTLVKEFNAKRTSNFCPAFIGTDAGAVMFTSNRQEKSAGNKKSKRVSPVTGAMTFNLYTSRRDKNMKWGEIELPDGLYGREEETSENENDSTKQKTGSQELGVCSFTGDGKTMYFTFSQPINGQDLGTKIFCSHRTGGEWGEPQEVKFFPDSSITVGHPSVNAAGDTIYFASDAPGGYGGKDLWMAELEGDTWINIQNLGSQINTSADEMFPCIRWDGVLYFSSNGHPGYGGLDIFRAVPTGEKDTNDIRLWDVYNMAIPFNSTGDDFGITFDGESENGLLSSNRGQKKGYDQIYSFILPELIYSVEGKLTDTNGDPIVDGILRLVGNDGTNQKLQVRKDGTYNLKLNKDVKYAMLATARGYLNSRENLTTEGLKDSKTYTQNFTLAPLSKPVKMDNVFYETGKWDLTPESETSLNALVKLLNDNPNITIELSAHTDMVGDSLSNKTLSEKRAQSCVNYLIKAGIEKERLTPVGYGENKPVVADQALHKQYPYIPIEQVLDEAFINRLESPQQRDVCNQINRRTEFKVLKTTYKLY